VARPLRDGEGRVELGGVEGGVDLEELGFGLGGREARGWGEGERGGGEGDGEEREEAGDGGDGRGGEGCPGSDLTDVPPEVLRGWVAKVDVKLADERGRRVRSAEVAMQGRRGLGG